MTEKTISGHYGTVYSIEHNNRTFLPKNVDVKRVVYNYNCIAAGELVHPDQFLPEHISVFWERYRSICDLYWEQREIYKQEEILKYRNWIRELRRTFSLSYDPVVALFQILLLPAAVPQMAFNAVCYFRAKKEIERIEFEQWVRDMRFKATQKSIREALKEYDREHATKLLSDMDDLVTKMTAYAMEGNEIVAWNMDIDEPQQETFHPRFATIEEIYDKCFEPSFRQFQEKQRPCRRYEGTYLEQIRERREKEAQTKGSKTEKSRSVAEAIEVVFTIGDMDNTGYKAAPLEAGKAAALLKDFCEHLMGDPHLCYVTTRELSDPHWHPPFKHGLLVLNLVTHCDEATPGVHLTCIPYSRGCKRGPDTQASLGRAMTGMGYPSTWKQVLDEEGKPVPKRNQNGDVILNADQTIRYQQEPDSQGIVDWIEDQKRWLAQEMQRRYEWVREYKGAYPRGHLSTPDYKVARAMERLAETNQAIKSSVEDFKSRVENLTDVLIRATSADWGELNEKEIILRYLSACPEEQYEKVLDEAKDFLTALPFDERAVAVQAFLERLQLASERAESKKEDTHKSTLQELER